MSESLSVSIVVPVYNEAASLADFLTHLVSVMRSQDQIIVVDGESTDHTEQVIHDFLALQLSQSATVRVHYIKSRKGRAVQMNLGARMATGEVLLFLHADTLLPLKTFDCLLRAAQKLQMGIKFWGRFNVKIQGRSVWLPLIGFFVSLRSRLTRISTGDQGLFLSKSLFNRVGGFYDQPLMEDIELCKTLKTQPDAQFIAIQESVVTSGRRWESHGVWPTVWLMWVLRYQYWRGANAYDLARKYRDVRQGIESNHAAACSLAGLDQTQNERT